MDTIISTVVSNNEIKKKTENDTEKGYLFCIVVKSEVLVMRNSTQLTEIHFLELKSDQKFPYKEGDRLIVRGNKWTMPAQELRGVSNFKLEKI